MILQAAADSATTGAAEVDVLEKLIAAPDKMALLALMLVLVILQLVRTLKPPNGKIEFDAAPIVAQLKMISDAQSAFIITIAEMQHKQTLLITTAMERQAGAREQIDEIRGSLEDHRRLSEGGDEGARRRRR